MSVLVDLFKELHAEIVTAMAPLVVERRYMPRVDGTELVDPRISVYMETAEREELARGFVDVERYTFGIAVQQAAAEQVVTDTDGNPVLDGIDNLAHGDAIINLAEKLKDLWRGDGPLKSKLLAGCSFVEFIHDPIYEPFHLASMGVYSSIVDVVYKNETAL